MSEPINDANYPEISNHTHRIEQLILFGFRSTIVCFRDSPLSSALFSLFVLGAKSQFLSTELDKYNPALEFWLNILYISHFIPPKRSSWVGMNEHLCDFPLGAVIVLTQYKQLYYKWGHLRITGELWVREKSPDKCWSRFYHVLSPMFCEIGHAPWFLWALI